ncbi:MAG TPA: hypothetical protein VKE41_05930 [Roseiflexaceae bacterium]|nr:hypothetical protein [Roseiflexaceae bacterium]
MRRIYGIGLAVLLALSIAPAVFAGNAHFIKNATSAARSGDSLVVSFKEAGLESGSTETITASATASATFQCVNGGNNVPSDPKKTTVAVRVSKSGEFTADKNGNIEGSLTINPPSAADVGFSCPPGQHATRTALSYSNVQIVDEDSGASFAINGSF